MDRKNGIDVRSSMLDAISNLIDSNEKSYSYDKTYIGRISAVNGNNKYNVKINGKIYTNVIGLPLYSFNINDMVYCLAPQGNLNQLRVILDLNKLVDLNVNDLSSGTITSSSGTITTLNSTTITATTGNFTNIDTQLTTHANDISNIEDKYMGSPNTSSLTEISMNATYTPTKNGYLYARATSIPVNAQYFRVYIGTSTSGTLIAGYLGTTQTSLGYNCGMSMIIPVTKNITYYIEGNTNYHKFFFGEGNE